MNYPKDRFLCVALDPTSFWGKWRDVTHESTLWSLHQMLKDTGRWDMWDLSKRHKKYDDAGWFGHLFWESDCAKWLEGACYFLQSNPDAALRAEVDELVTAMLDAQQPDGYLNINFCVIMPDQKWTNVRDWHEMYNAGHCFEAAVAHYDLTQDDKFLKAMIRYAHLIRSKFGPEEDKLHGYPGHPEIELALTKLHVTSGDQTCLELAKYFLDERGRNHGQFYKDEQKARGEDERIHPGSWPTPGCEWYQQAHDLIINQDKVEGHSVRVGYLLTGLADLVIEGSGTDEQRQALYRLWIQMISKRSSVTGGIGAIGQWEGFARQDYNLPNGLDEGGCYNETCAGVSLLMLADRLQALQLHGPSITDVAERVLYNSSLITGMSLDGKLFTYENRLASSPGDPAKRYPYFDCSCCPPNVLRTMAIIGGYFWSPLQGTDLAIAIHHYFTGQVHHANVKLDMKTNYPWSGKVVVDVHAGQALLRVPSWSSLEMPEMDLTTRYATLSQGHWELDLDVKPRLIYSHPFTGKNELAIAFGPLIYCVEDVDNPTEISGGGVGHFKDMTIEPSILDKLTLIPFKDEQGHEIIKLFAPAAGRRLRLHTQPTSLEDTQRLKFAELEGPAIVSQETFDLTFVPYYYRANRNGQGMMRVWLLNRMGFTVGGH
ncbi:unnamed protein product [Sympodiomycopsis kandeliae]